MLAKLKYLSEAIATRYLNWLADRSATRTQRRRDELKQHWRAAAVGGGGTVELGYVTETDAIQKLQNIKSENEPIVYVDTDQAFIAYGRMPDPMQ